MADNQGTYRITIQVVGDDVAAKLSGVNREFEQLSKVVDKANAKLRDHNKAHKGTANFYDQQIKLLKDLRDRLARTTGETNKYNVAIDNLTKKKAALSAPMKGTLAAFKLELQELRLQQAQVAKTSTQWDAYEKKIASVRSKVDALTGSQRIQTKTNKDMISNAGLGGAVLTELGRTVSDANYGFTAMANNLSQLSTLFITLTAKTEGGFKQTIKDLGKQMMGPLGIVLALQLAITLFEKFAISQKSAASAAKSVTDEIYAQSVALGVIVDKIESTNTSEEERIRLTKVLIDEVPNLTKQDFAYGENLDLVREKILKYTLAQAARAEMDKLVADNSEILAKRSAIDRIKALDDETESEEKLAKIREFLISQGVRLSGLTGALTKAGTRQRWQLTTGQIQERFAELSLAIERETDPILKKIYELAEGLDTFGGKKIPEEKVKDYLKMLNELYDEIFVKDENRFDAQIKQIQLELDKRLQSYDEILKKEKLTETERASFLRARINAEQLASEKIQDIEEARAKFIRESAQKILDDQRKSNDKQLADALKSVKDIAELRRAEEYKGAESIIKDKERLAEKLKEIDIEILKFQIEVIQQGIKDTTIATEDGIKAIAALQIQLTKLSSKASKERVLTAKEEMEELGRISQELAYALVDAMQLQLDAELSKEERKTVIQNNALKDRLNNEKLSAKQKEAINDQIAANEAKLQKKRDELAEKNFKLQKTVAIAETLIATYKMAADAYGTIKGMSILGLAATPLAFAAAATATAFGLAQVNAIRQQQFVPSAIGVNSGSGGAGGSGVNAPDFNIVGQSPSNQIAQAVQGQFDKPVKAYVVSKDITTAQEMDRNIIGTATL